MSKPPPDPSNIPEFDRVMRGLVAVPKAEVEKAEARRVAKKTTGKAKPPEK